MSSDNFDRRLLLPSLIFLGVCVLTIIFSLFATKPNIKKTVNTEGENFDILFFNSYASLSKEEYLNRMTELIEDEPKLMEKKLTNIHAQGVVLIKKYNQLKIAYTIFMIGFPCSMALFIFIYLSI